MANISTPFGFRQYSGAGSAPTFEQVPVVIGKTGVALISERYDRVAKHESVLRETAQLFHRPCDGGRVEARRFFGPAGRKNADQFALLKTRRQYSRARSRIHRMYEWCA